MASGARDREGAPNGPWEVNRANTKAGSGAESRPGPLVRVVHSSPEPSLPLVFNSDTPVKLELLNDSLDVIKKPGDGSDQVFLIASLRRGLDFSNLFRAFYRSLKCQVY